ncbi:hypothetical protein C5F50_01695 [Nitrosopumilus ureiphilus]|uniref:Nucleoside 2-deoxyribosyltransferase n=1 Tax=Nitrosopumilus ureiphilus TaxID=1470067 RepID=A0A7D5M350_9ARCH|nr:hypothetical protein C5F50_01695 [Nitrosopumilus ureiphilus]
MDIYSSLKLCSLVLNQQEQTIKIFLANPLGFSEAGRFFLKEKFIPQIQNDKIRIINPWRNFDSDEKKIQEILKKDANEQDHELNEFNEFLGDRNESDLRSSDMVIAILDGVDVDSGTAAEIGLAYGLGKKIIGYRGDLRQTGENNQVQINLQVEYDIKKSGGKILNSIEQLSEYLKNEVEHI